MAFVGGSSFLGTQKKATAVCSQRSKATRQTVMQINKGTQKEIETPTKIEGVIPEVTAKKPQKDEEVLTGFTRFAERLNGRAAMFGFAVAVATEAINQNHPTIVEQVLSLAVGKQ
eukprot:Plantae.Rhodophyta-Purpureofilum_apyrenoidigerum.ctg17219.p1 GENE.Plantae.Rhodophyta-Purpureofilum_apyrenoidigerum.ctg17219~~Plantae.Rhodophyta-Purpureofilum_apyrenoidigerum.ctg17219.p1  ORF type:complete len:115 (+),score=17.33 Plantae.Rhodophyta-Purpureofilum_apyrenoidigerum.ctg17219:1086-1430(+)